MSEENTNPKEKEQEQEQDPKPKNKTSAEIVDDDKPRKLRKLEEKVSSLEDLLTKTKAERDELQVKFNELGKKLTGSAKRSIFTEIEEELWGKKKDQANE